MPFSFSKKKILVVEDSAPLSNAVRIKLKTLGFKVLIAASYEEAKKLLGKHKKIAAVWIDHWLKGSTTGLEVLKYIRADETHRNTPTFLVSNCGEEWSDKYEQYGISKRFIKSNYTMSDIIEAINHEIE